MYTHLKGEFRWKNEHMMTSSNGNIFHVTGPMCREFLRSPVNSPHKVQWCGALMFPLIRAWINSWVHNHEAGDLRCHCTHYDVIVMTTTYLCPNFNSPESVQQRDCIFDIFFILAMHKVWYIRYLSHVALFFRPNGKSYLISYTCDCYLCIIGSWSTFCTNSL